MRILTFILNLPWTIVGLLEICVALPKGIRFDRQRLAFIVHVQSLWWWKWISKHKNVRAITHGNVVILSPNIVDRDEEHELIHVDQFHRYPFVFPLLYLFESGKGYKNNKYEKEAYEGAGNPFIEE
jgi:hypothetical protein